MTRGNDAIPSWSGYNYQGKITLLETLIKINELLSNNKVINQNTFVEIEANEDFVMYVDGLATGLYQVKAYLSTTKVTSYIPAMEKLIEHRNNIGYVGATCFLCIPLDIKDWSDSQNIYSSIIKIYKPYGECVRLEVVPSLIKQEIKKILLSRKFSTNNKDEIYLELCNFLDNKIRDMHIKGKKKRNYKIFLSELMDFILKQNINIKASNEAKQKEKVYEYIINEFKNSVDMYCNNYCSHKRMGICHNDVYGSCSIYKCYEFIANINIWDYCRYINPHINDGWDNPLNYISNMNPNTFNQLLIPVFNEVMAKDMVSNNNLIYCNSNIYNIENVKIIPTLLTFYSGLIPSDIAIQEKLKIIKNNNFILSEMAGNIITADTNGNIYNTESDSILSFGDSKKDDIRNLKDSIKIVDSKKFIYDVKKTNYLKSSKI